MRICLKRKEPRCVKDSAAGVEVGVRDFKIFPKKKEHKWKSDEDK